MYFFHDFLCRWKRGGQLATAVARGIDLTGEVNGTSGGLCVPSEPKIGS